MAELAGPGDLVARFGGDEFVILCPAPEQAELQPLAERVVRAVRAAVPRPGGAADRSGSASAIAVGPAGGHRRRADRPGRPGDVRGEEPPAPACGAAPPDR